MKMEGGVDMKEPVVMGEEFRQSRIGFSFFRVDKRKERSIEELVRLNLR